MKVSREAAAQTRERIEAPIVPMTYAAILEAYGHERFVAAPMVDHTANGTSYLPLAQISDWASAIARLAGHLAH